MLRYWTGGESQGKAFIAFLEGLLSGLEVVKKEIDLEVRRRMQGYGRGDRMKIEDDSVEILSGLKNGTTLGSPITLLVNNRDRSTSQFRS